MIIFEVYFLELKTGVECMCELQTSSSFSKNNFFVCCACLLQEMKVRGPFVVFFGKN